MNPKERNEIISRADEILGFAKKIFSDKRSELLRKAATLYKEATLSKMAEILEKEAIEWEENSNHID